MPNDWNTFIQQHTTPQALALSNKMKELNVKNKFRYKLGPGGYKAAMPKWVQKEQELRDARIPDPLEGCTMCTRNWIRGHSRIDDSERLSTSSSEVTSVIEKIQDSHNWREDWRIHIAAGERPTQRSPRELGTSWSYSSNLFNCIVEGRVCR
jgi:hypothetical protein